MNQTQVHIAGLVVLFLEISLGLVDHAEVTRSIPLSQHARRLLHRQNMVVFKKDCQLVLHNHLVVRGILRGAFSTL